MHFYRGIAETEAVCDGDLLAVSNANEESNRGTGRASRPDAGLDDLHAPSYGSKYLPESAHRLFRCYRGVHLSLGPVYGKNMRPPVAARRQRGHVPQHVDARAA